MKKEEITDLLAQFESISSTVEGIECWSARDLQPLLGYAKWDNFINNVVVKAKEACMNIFFCILDCERLKAREKLSQTEKDNKRALDNK